MTIRHRVWRRLWIVAAWVLREYPHDIAAPTQRKRAIKYSEAWRKGAVAR